MIDLMLDALKEAEKEEDEGIEADLKVSHSKKMKLTDDDIVATAMVILLLLLSYYYTTTLLLFSDYSSTTFLLLSYLSPTTPLSLPLPSQQIMLVAGYDTTGVTLSYLAYAMSKNPEIQEKLQAEVDQAFEESNGELPDYNTIQVRP